MASPLRSSAVALAAVLSALALPGAAHAALAPNTVNVFAGDAAKSGNGLEIHSTRDAGEASELYRASVGETAEGDPAVVFQIDNPAQDIGQLAVGCYVDDPATIICPAPEDKFDFIDLYTDASDDSVILEHGIVKPTGTVYAELGVGNDSLSGSNAADHADYRIEAFGNEGADEITGGDASDLIGGGTDEDNLSGGLGDDDIEGGDLNDQLHGGQGNDTLEGDDGNDRLDGDEGNDQLMGGGGNDDLFGWEGSDAYEGGDGDDFVRARAYDKADVDVGPLDCGAGNDTLIRDITDPAKDATCEFEDPGFDGTPVIKGTKLVGQTLTVDGFTVFGDPAPLQAEWYSCASLEFDDCKTIGKDATYTLTASEAGRFVGVTLTLKTPESHGSEDYYYGADLTPAISAVPGPVAPVKIPELTPAQQFAAAAIAKVAAALPGAKPIASQLPANILVLGGSNLTSGPLTTGKKASQGTLFGFKPTTKPTPVLAVGCQTACTVEAKLAVSFKSKGKKKTIKLKTTHTKVPGPAAPALVTLKLNKAQAKAVAKGTKPKLSVELKVTTPAVKAPVKTKLSLVLSKKQP